MKRLTPFDFIEKATNIHGDKYDYSKIIHVYASEKVTIICKKHNFEFQQRPTDHLRGNGCTLCSGKKKKSTSDFIEAAKIKHGEKYIYEKVNYINSETKVLITCKIHGDFEQTPASHLFGFGCDKCRGSYKITLEEFINNAKIKHHGKYAYSKVNYLNQATKVIITCPIHGDFEQLPKDHLNGSGCSSCSGKKKKTTTDFIQEANKIHKGKYGYEKVVYINNRKKVLINCPEHGIFEQVAFSHLSGKGCAECSGTKKINTIEFIEKSKQVHGNRYKYDKVKYINSKSKVIITCNIHGDFEQSPNNHLQKQGCSFCGGSENLTTEEFIKKAQQTHGNKYNYDKVKYINGKTKVIITCPFHGVFKQAPNNHIKGQGCPRCKTPRGEAEIETVLQKLQIKFEPQYTFDDCIDKRKLPFDFAIFIDNQIGLIEFHGEQHYERVYFGNTNEQHEEAKIRDKIKVQYAQSKGIPLLTIPYNEIDSIGKTIEKFVRENLYGQLETTLK